MTDSVRIPVDGEKTYTWLGQVHPISGPQYSDIEVAGLVRMLMRDQLNHEMVCVLARDRIVHLSERVAELEEKLKHEGELYAT